MLHLLLIRCGEPLLRTTDSQTAGYKGAGRSHRMTLAFPTACSWLQVSFHTLRHPVLSKSAMHEQARAAEAVEAAAPNIVRNAGGAGVRDISLENFSVSNGGQDLIEVRHADLYSKTPSHCTETTFNASSAAKKSTLLYVGISPSFELSIMLQKGYLHSALAVHRVRAGGFWSPYVHFKDPE